MKALFGLVFLCVAPVSLTAVSVPVVITFDDINANSGGSRDYPTPPSGYYGLQWINFEVLNTKDFAVSGYESGVVSPDNVAFNSGGGPAAFSSSAAFDLDSAYLTAAWNDGLQVEAQGFVGSVLTYDNTYILSATAPTLINFNYRGVNEVNFIASGGTAHDGYSGAGTQFAMDNMTISAPEPGTIGLLVFGAALVGLGGRRGRKAIHSTTDGHR